MVYYYKSAKESTGVDAGMKQQRQSRVAAGHCARLQITASLTSVDTPLSWPMTSRGFVITRVHAFCVLLMLIG